ncbi:MAG: PspC domain-containing protein [Clostridia bacterium]|nr:PspC domain-containing protein [Clostridia bacterium]
MKKRLFKSKTDKKISGVCGGVAAIVMPEEAE